MPTTVVRGAQVKDGSIQRDDIDIATVGQALIRKIVQGRGVRFVSTGADAGTGDVTIDADPSTTSILSATTWTPNADTDDVYNIASQSAAVSAINNPTGTPVNGQTLTIRYKDNGTARTLNWSGTQWEASPGQSLPTTTIAGVGESLLFMWNSTTSKWTLFERSRGPTGDTFQTTGTGTNPTGTTSTTGVMMGLGSAGGQSANITPQISTQVLVIIAVGAQFNSGSSISTTSRLRYGTGTAPNNGAALTGTAVGAAWQSSAPAGQGGGATLLALITGLTIGTTYWLDLEVKTGTAGNTATVAAVAITAIEIP
jgi:hypothetical protein